MTLLHKITRLPGKYHQSTLKNVELLLAGLLSARSVSLYKIKDELSVLTGKTDASRHTHYWRYYKRLLRIFERYGSTRLFIDLLLWATGLILGKVEHLFGFDRVEDWSVSVACTGPGRQCERGSGSGVFSHLYS